MADYNPEVEITFERKELSKLFMRLPTQFSTMPDSDMTLPTWPDINRHLELKMSATKPEVEITIRLFPLPAFVVAILGSGCRPMSDNVGGDMCESGIVENVGVAVDM